MDSPTLPARMNPYIRLPKARVVDGRQGIILQKCVGRKVLHLGCVDAGLLPERFPRGELMHQRLSTVASDLWGVDIDADGISFLRRHGFDKVIVGDVNQFDSIAAALEGRTFDIVVASEIIEHLLNPGLFLNSLGRSTIGQQAELIVTLPNAFRIDTLLWLLRGVEYVHPDHNYWFSYHTGTNLLQKNGYEIQELYVYSFQPRTIMPKTVGENRPTNRGLGTTEAAAPTLPPWPRRLPSQILRYVLSLPRRLAVAALYRTTVFWGDGIILVARVPHNASRQT